MKSRTIIIILAVVIVIQTIAGVLIFRKVLTQAPPFPPFGIMEEHMGMEPGMEMRPGKHRMMGNRFGRQFCSPEFMKDKLSLDGKQAERISELNRKFDSEFAGYIKQINPEREKLKDMLENGSTDMQAVKNQLKKIEDLNIEIHMLRIKQGKEIDSILTPEQMNILRSERKMFFEKMQKYHGGMK